MQVNQNNELEQVNRSLNYIFINSLNEIEETTRELHMFVENAAAAATCLDNTQYEVSYRVAPIKKLYESLQPCEKCGLDCLKKRALRQTKKTLERLKALSTEKKQEYMLSRSIMHGDITKCIQFLYQGGPRSGICHGFALMGLQAILTKSIDNFNDRLKRLALYLTLKPDDGDLSEVIQKIQSENDLDLLAFFEGIELCSRGANYSDLFTENQHPHSQLSKKFINSVLPIVASNELQNTAIVEIEQEEPTKELATVGQTSGAYSFKELSEYFRSLQSTLEQTPLPDAPIALLIKNLQHTCVIGYDPQENIWTYIDANAVFPQKTDDINQLARLVRDGLNHANYRHTFMHTSIFSTKDQIAFWTDLLSKWNRHPTFRKIHRINPHAPLKNNALLLVASRYGDTDSILKFTGKKRPLDNTIPSFLDTPLYTASAQGHEETVIRLLEAGANINKTNTKMETPLFIASQMGHTKIVQILLQNDADIHIFDVDGNSPLFIAQRHGHQKIVEMITQAQNKKRKRETTDHLDAPSEPLTELDLTWV